MISVNRATTTDRLQWDEGGRDADDCCRVACELEPYDAKLRTVRAAKLQRQSMRYRGDEEFAVLGQTEHKRDRKRTPAMVPRIR